MSSAPGETGTEAAGNAETGATKTEETATHAMEPGDTAYLQEAAHRPPHGGPGAAEGPYELPPGEGMDRVTLLVRDPWCVYAFWEVTAQGWERAVGRLPSGGPPPRLVLRIHYLPATGPADLGTAANRRHHPWTPSGRWRDLVVAGTDRWYIHLEVPGQRVAVEIGAGTLEVFAPIARSTAVVTPPGTVAGEEHGQWLTHWLTAPAPPRVPIGIAGDAGSPGLWARAVTPVDTRETY